MRQALAKQLVYLSLFVASCVVQPWIQFARSVVIHFEQSWELTEQLETAEGYRLSVSWRSYSATALLCFASSSINTRYLDEYE